MLSRFKFGLLEVSQDFIWRKFVKLDKEKEKGIERKMINEWI